MKALVFGSKGQLGRALQARASAGWTIDGHDLPECNITDEAATRAMIADGDHDIVINAAAYTQVDKAESEPELAQLVNGDAPGWMASECAISGKAFVHISTDFIFGGAHSSPIKTDAKAEPLSIYGKTKLAGELAVQAALPDALIIRSSWVYAAVGANFVLTMLRLMKERDELGVVADQVGSPTAANDLADAVMMFAAAGAKGMFHFTNAGECSWHEFAVAIAEEGVAAGLLSRIPRINPITTADYPTPAVRPAYSVLEKVATWDVLGKPARHWRAALRDILKEIKANG